jgi:two-component system response regulator AtoC
VADGSTAGTRKTQREADSSVAGGRDFPLMTKNSPPLRVLIVDDEPLIRWSVAETLTGSGDVVIEAGDAKQALEALSAASEPVDVVLLDYRLPDSNDLGLLATVRRVAPGSQVIVMTAHGTWEITTGALALGAYGVVNKPFDLDHLASLVRQACAAPTVLT